MHCPNCGDITTTESVDEKDPGLDLCLFCGYAYDHKNRIEKWVSIIYPFKRRKKLHESAFVLPTGRFG